MQLDEMLKLYEKCRDNYIYYLHSTLAFKLDNVYQLLFGDISYNINNRNLSYTAKDIEDIVSHFSSRPAEQEERGYWHEEVMRGLFISTLVNANEDIGELIFDVVNNINYFYYKPQKEINVRVNELCGDCAFEGMFGGNVSVSKLRGKEAFYKMSGGVTVVNNLSGVAAFCRMSGGSAIVNNLSEESGFYRMSGGSARIFYNSPENSFLHQDGGNVFILENNGRVMSDVSVRDWNAWQPETPEQWFADKVMQALHEGYFDGNTLVMFPHLLDNLTYDIFRLPSVNSFGRTLRWLGNTNESPYAFIQSYYCRSNSEARAITKDNSG